MRIYLVRHGQTDWNLQGKIQGRCDIPLNETGKEQAHLLGIAMKEYGILRIVSSPQKRAKETAEIIGEQLGLPVQVCLGIQETSFGRFEGRSFQEMKDQLELFDGEKKEEVILRFSNVVDDLLASEQDLMIVSHGCALSYWLSSVLKEELGGPIILENTSITTLDYDRDKRQFVLIELNKIVDDYKN